LLNWIGEDAMSKESRGEASASGRAQLVQIKPGFFLNLEQIVSVRVLPQEEGQAYAVLQLSNGDKLNLTRDEFSSLTGEEARRAARVQRKPEAAS
jgi:hypothetical protein